MEVPLPHVPRQLDGVQHVARSERPPHNLWEVLGQGAPALRERPRHIDEQSEVVLAVSLFPDSELVFGGSVRLNGGKYNT